MKSRTTSVRQVGVICGGEMLVVPRVEVLQIVVIACLDVGQIASGETQSGPQNLPRRREPLP